MASSASGSSKRARGANNGDQPVSCLVDGCNSDLSNCRDYHRRHKVCELHSKAPQVTIGGLKQRFCQQCSRFHSLEEFDEGKRSCRKRLDGHNRRRRKPQADLMPRSGSFITYHQGSPLSPYSSSQVFPLTTVGISHGWSSSSSAATDPTTLQIRNQQLNLLEKQNPFLESNNYDKAAFLQIENQHGDFPCRPLLRTINTLSENGNERNNKMVYDKFTIGESDCALSLLSSSQTRMDPGESGSSSSSGFMGLSRIEQRNSFSLLQRMSNNRGGFETASDSIRIENESNGVVNFQGMFGIGSENPGNESPSTLPFHWE